MFTDKKFVSRQNFQYSLDVLTDGSECTGHGTVFLSVARKSAYSQSRFEDDTVDDERNIQEGPILARYALTGLSTLTARLATDQSYKLSYVRAIFSPYRTDVMSTAGIPSLLLSLSNYSSTGNLSVVGPVGTSDFMEELSKLILGIAREYPKIAVCEVPSFVQDATSCWWKVFEDEYILVHARSLRPTSLHTFYLNHDAIVYIVTIRCDSDDAKDELDNYSFAICPPYLDMSTFTSKILQPLPDIVVAQLFHAQDQQSSERIELHKRKKLPLEFLLLCDPYTNSIGCVQESSHLRIHMHSSLLTLSDQFMATIPETYYDCDDGRWDHGLLIRAVQQSQTLHSCIPSAFPLRLNTEPSPAPKQSSTHAAEEEDGHLTQLCYKLRSCMSVTMNTSRLPVNSQDKSRFHYVDRKKRIWERKKDFNIQSHVCDTQQVQFPSMNKVDPFRWGQRPRDPNEIDLDDPIYSHEDFSTISNSNKRLKFLKEGAQVDDPNEIDLDDPIYSHEDFSTSSNSNKRLKIFKEGAQVDSESIDEHYSPNSIMSQIHEGGGGKVGPAQMNLVNNGLNLVPQILILGTGCAAPAPLRGSSGYAILIPTVNEMDSVPSLALAGMIECGEGCLISLSRFIPQQPNKSFKDHLASLEWVWISHAHFDHYGELPVLIHYLNLMRGESCQCFRDTRALPASRLHLRTHDRRICPQCQKASPLLVIAPTKVLRFVDIALCTMNGVLHNSTSNSYTRLFVGLAHQDFDVLSPDIQDTYLGVNLSQKRRFTMRNIPVQHCAHSFALILGFQSFGVTFTLCYSGDTRPCRRLAQACRNESIVTGEKITLLIHEATFDDDQPMEAMKKSHCTVSEALGIFKNSGAASCILSHFSQRYPRLPPSLTGSYGNAGDGISYGMAADGMLIPLDEKLLANLTNFNTTVQSVLQRMV